MTYFDVIILSIVEGITEFLPISSTGHMVLVSHIFSIAQTPFVKSFEIFIQLGAILAVALLYWKRFLQGKEVWIRIGAAFIPTAVVGFLLYKIVKTVLLGNPLITVLALFIGGVLLIIIEKFLSPEKMTKTDITDLTIPQSALLGLVQAVSVIPGVSRAAATIIGAMFMGSSRTMAVEFSFLLAIPTMMAATGYDLLKSQLVFTTEEYSFLFLGFIASFIVAYIVVKFFIKYIQKHTFIPFGIYRIVLSIVYFLLFLR